MDKITYEQITSWFPCPHKSFSQVQEYIDGGKTALEILETETLPPEIRIWILLHPEVLPLPSIKAFAWDCTEKVLKREANEARYNDELRVVDSAHDAVELAFTTARAADRVCDFADDASVCAAEVAADAAHHACAAAAHATAVAAVAHAGYVGTTYPSEVHNNIEYERRWQLERLRYYLLREISLL